MLGEVCTITMGQAPSGESYNNSQTGLPLVAGAGDFGDVLPAPKKYTTAPRKTSCVGDILVGIRASIGDRVWSDREYCLGRGVAGLRAKSGLDSQYLWHWLGYSAPHLAAKGRGATFLQVNRKDITDMEIALPPLDEQRRIAAILDHAASLRAKRQELLQHQRDLPRAVFTEMFGPWNGPFATIADVALPEKGSIRTGPFGSQLLHSEFVDQGIAVLGLDNVVGNEFTWGERRYITSEKYEDLRRYTVRPGDVLMSIMGTCGRCVVVPNDIETAINTKHICAITVDPRRALPDFVRAAFLWHPMSRQFLARMTKGSVMDGLNMGIIKATPIPLPGLDAQEVFVDRVNTIDKCIRVSKDLQVKSDELFTSIQIRAFRGEL